MVKEETLLKDDELYLKDLTSKCELKAREWDQRSQMRAEEVTALTAALKIIKGRVSDNSKVNRAAFIQHNDADIAADVQALKIPEQKEDARNNVEDDDIGSVSFLQVSNPRLKIASLVNQASTVSTRESQQAALKEKVIKSLVEKGKKARQRCPCVSCHE